MKNKRLVCFVVVFLGFGASALGQIQTQYYAVMLSGKKVGHAVYSRHLGGGRVTTTNKMKLTISRVGVQVTVEMTETTVETPDGKPLGFTVVQNLGALPITIEGKITEDGKILLTPSVGPPRDFPHGALMSEGMRILQLEKGLKAGTSYSAKFFSPSHLQAFDMIITVGPKKKVDLFGRVVMLTEMKASIMMSAVPMITTEYVDEDLNTLRSITPVVGTMVELIACDKSFALGEDDVVDFLIKLMLKSPTQLTGLASASAATYRMVPKKGAKLLFPATDNQTVRSNGDGSVTVTVRPVRPAAGATLPYMGPDPAAREALLPSQFVQSNDPKVRSLARKAVGDTTDAAEAIRRIESFVGTYISGKSLSVGYASAAEVATSKEGDCSEHAVLTAAMCRAVGIPAQVAVGIVYADQFAGKRGVFVGHAWTRAFVAGKWIGLDATGRNYGPGHITEAVGNGDPADFFQVLNTLGNYTIAEARLIKSP